MSRIKVGVLGAGGTVGQRFVQLLEDHPWFEVTALAGSERTQGRAYAEVVQWHLGDDPPEYAREMVLRACEPGIDCDIVFSALPGEIAGPMETRFAAAGYKVFTNAGAHRMDIAVPLMVPYLNPEHLAAIPAQQSRHNWRGFILSNPNCASIPLAMALAPLRERFGVSRVFVTTMQAISGAGYPGVASYDILGDVVPYIGGEEQKLETEPLKILGTWNGASFESAAIQISAQCHRVPVREGHLLAISADLGADATEEGILATWREWRPAAVEMGLPSAPKRPLVYRTEPDRPRPGRDVMASDGMGAVLGRLRPCPLLGWKFSALGHNTVLGAAGCSLLNAELYVASVEH